MTKIFILTACVKTPICRKDGKPERKCKINFITYRLIFFPANVSYMQLIWFVKTKLIYPSIEFVYDICSLILKSEYEDNN